MSDQAETRLSLDDEPADRGNPTAAAARRISVMHLLYTMAYGGIETVIINWLRRLDRERFDVALVCFETPHGGEKPFIAAAERHGLRVETIPWGRQKPVIRACRTLARLLQKHRVDVLHTHNCYADLVGVITARFVPVKTITTSYVWDDLGWKLNLIQFIELQAIRFCDRVTAHCEATRRGSIERGFAPDEVRTLISGFEAHRCELTPEERRRRRAELGVEDDQILLVNVARMYPEKEQGFLLDVFADVSRLHPEVRLAICGVGPLEAELRAKCTRLGLDPVVRFLNFVEDLPALLALADIQVHPALIEGVPQGICAGMAAALPVIASDVGGVSEVVRDGQTGVLVALGDRAGFARAVCGLIEDDSRRVALGTEARRFICDDYSLERAVQCVEDTYLEMTASA